MIAVTVVFDKTWLKNQLADGVRVVRKLEKWVVEMPDCKLKSSGPEQLVVEVEDDRQAEFIAQLEAELRVNYAVEEPAEVFSFSSKEVVKADSPAADGAKKLAVNGINNPAADGAKKPAPDCGGESSEQISSIIDPEKATNVFRVLASLIRQVPLCHCKALVDYFKDTMEVVPMLMHMNALDSFWRMCPLLSIDSGYGLSAFLYELAELYAALELTKGVNEK